ncbi:hypothetical protein D3Z36_10950 [Lachnospiraceae bacterium]|nr:hypothetical protein [Lachnospiraceae bacterium]
MNHKTIHSIYDGSLPVRTNPFPKQGGSGSGYRNDSGESGKSSYLYRTNHEPDPGSSPQQAPLIWTAPPVVSAAADTLESNFPGI